MAFEPFIVTAELPRDVFAWADGLRRAHFPPERNHLEAHVTLFHALAPSLFEELKPLLKRVVAEHPPQPARITGIMPLGKGTALRIDSRGMTAIREDIAERFHGALTAQDRHPLRLHVTVQNKVTVEAARTLQEELGAAFKPRDFAFTGLGLHIYRGGPWEAVGRWSFRG
ncbi:MAG: 2'-5' RNA ligase family protein [Sphingomonadales bacterium]|nr:2'-5' RNA ligase family protein [Sphingomonadales bacterium]MDE2570561.1 2'-5' RNA ligase family protein [Sphingomonadales bacterium]